MGKVHNCALQKKDNIVDEWYINGLMGGGVQSSLGKKLLAQESEQNMDEGRLHRNARIQILSTRIEKEIEKRHAK